MTDRSCISCGSLATETWFPRARIHGLPEVCVECALEWATEIYRVPALLDYIPKEERA